MQLTDIDKALALIPEARKLLTDTYNEKYKAHLEAKQNIDRKEAKLTLELMAKYDIDSKKGADKQTLLKKIKSEVVELLHLDRMGMICLQAEVEKLHQDIKSMTEEGIGLNVRMSLEKSLVNSGVHFGDNTPRGKSIYSEIKAKGGLL